MAGSSRTELYCLKEVDVAVSTQWTIYLCKKHYDSAHIIKFLLKLSNFSVKVFFFFFQAFSVPGHHSCCSVLCSQFKVRDYQVF